MAGLCDTVLFRPVGLLLDRESVMPHEKVQPEVLALIAFEMGAREKNQEDWQVALETGEAHGHALVAAYFKELEVLGQSTKEECLAIAREHARLLRQSRLPSARVVLGPETSPKDIQEFMAAVEGLWGPVRWSFEEDRAPATPVCLLLSDRIMSQSGFQHMRSALGP